MADKPSQDAASAKPANKKEAVAESLKKLGRNARPLAIRDDIKVRHGIDVDPEYISKLKAVILGTKGKKAVTKPAPVAAKSAAATKPAPAAKPAASKDSANGRKDAYLLEDVMIVKKLVERIGLEQVRKLLGVFDK